MIQTIRPANEIFQKLFAAFPNKGERRCKYVLTEPCDEGLLLWNTLSLALYLWEGRTAEDWVQERFSADDRRELTRHWLLVPDTFEEARTVEQLRSLVRAGQTLETKFTIFTTTACNARCPYCFEKGFSKKTMSEETARNVADFILRTNKAEEFRIDWFGGEPLLNTRAIDIICRRLKDAGANFFSHMKSNGWLFTPELVSRIKEDWNFHYVQITLDGTDEVYARTKRFVGNPEKPLEHVLENVNRLLDEAIEVKIRLNVSEENIDDLSALICQLKERFGKYENFKIRVAPLIEMFHRENSPELENYTKKYLELVQLTNPNNSRKNYLPKTWPVHKCMADNPNTQTINCEGKLIRCEFCFDDGISGDIYSGDTRPDLLAYWSESIKYERCTSCPINPVCYDLKHCPWTDGLCNSMNLEISLYRNLRAMLAELRRWREIERDFEVDRKICGRVIGEYVDSLSRKDKEGKGYTGTQATPYYVLDEVFRHVSLDPERDKIIDVGCGKGLVIAYLLKENLLPTESISGIELNPDVHYVLKEWTQERYPAVNAILGNALECDLNPYSVIFISRPFYHDTFRLWLKHFESTMRHSVKFIYWSDQESGYLLEGRPGWTKHYQSAPKVWSINGYAYLGCALRGFSIWTYDPALSEAGLLEE